MPECVTKKERDLFCDKESWGERERAASVLSKGQERDIGYELQLVRSRRLQIFRRYRYLVWSGKFGYILVITD